MENNMIEQCRAASTIMRQDILQMGMRAGSAGAHYGGSLSMVEILAVLYLSALRQGRNRFILSKGHGGMTQYAAMKQARLLSAEELDTFKQDETILTAHPGLHPEKGLEFASGSLGQGLSFGVGMALALRQNAPDARVYVLLGDGECNEGQIWEAAAAAAHFKLDKMVVIVDSNGLQYDGSTDNVFSMAPMMDKWRAFGWEAIDVDGHDVSALLYAFSMPVEKPLAVIAHTVKGKGVSFMENAPQWHHARMSQKQFEAAMAELAVQNA